MNRKFDMTRKYVVSSIKCNDLKLRMCCAQTEILINPSGAQNMHPGTVLTWIVQRYNEHRLPISICLNASCLMYTDIVLLQRRERGYGCICFLLVHTHGYFMKKETVSVDTWTHSYQPACKCQTFSLKCC